MTVGLGWRLPYTVEIFPTGAVVRVARCARDGQAALLRGNSKVMREEYNDTVQHVCLVDVVPDARSYEARVNAHGDYVGVFRVFEQPRLQLSDPHLQVQLIVRVVLALHARLTVEVLKVQDPRVLEIGRGAHDARVGAFGQRGQEMESQQDVGEQVDLVQHLEAVLGFGVT